MTSPRTATRVVVLGAIRALGLVVAVGASTVGIVHLIGVAIGLPVWRITDPVSGAGGFVDLPLPLKLAHAIALLLWCLTIAGTALVVSDLARRVRRRVDFVPALSRAAWTLAVVLGVGSWVARIATTVATQSGLYYPDDVDPATVPLADLPIVWSFGPQTLLPDPGLLGLAVVFALLAWIVQSGERLQRDVEGLV